MIKHADPRIERYLQLLVIVCAVGVLILLVVEFSLPLSEEQKLIVEIVNAVILLVFVIELLYNIYYTNDKKGYLKAHWLDVIAVLPILEVFRVAKIAEVSRIGMLSIREGAELSKAGELLKVERIAKADEAVQVVELAKAGKVAEILKAERAGTGLERFYEGFRVFWHEKLAFGNRNSVSIPLKLRDRK